MKTKTILNLDYLKVEGNLPNYIYYGGDQEWFGINWRKISGCGPTTASSIIMYENRKNNLDDSNYTKSEFLALMNEVWDFITPIKGKGVNTIELFFEGFKEYIKENKARIVKPIFFKIPIEFKNRPETKELFRFINEALKKEHVVAFLNLDNGEEKKLYKWHWVAVIGISYDALNDKLDALIADEGIIKRINLSLWLKTTKNEGGFVYFE